MEYKDPRSGFKIKINEPSAGLGFMKAMMEMEHERNVWLEKLMAAGIRAVHPDDGWVNRNEDTFILHYPYFDLGVRIGDRVVLGSPKEYRIVEVTGIEQRGVISSITYHKFKVIETIDNRTKTKVQKRRMSFFDKIKKFIKEMR